jgi:hypothetical protein
MGRVAVAAGYAPVTTLFATGWHLGVYVVAGPRPTAPLARNRPSPPPRTRPIHAGFYARPTRAPLPRAASGRREPRRRRRPRRTLKSVEDPHRSRRIHHQHERAPVADNQKALKGELGMSPADVETGDEGLIVGGANMLLMSAATGEGPVPSPRRPVRPRSPTTRLREIRRGSVSVRPAKRDRTIRSRSDPRSVTVLARIHYILPDSVTVRPAKRDRTREDPLHPARFGHGPTPEA